MHNIILVMTRRITISLDDQLVEELKNLAKNQNVSLSRFIANSLREYLIEKKKQKVGKKILNLKLSEKDLKVAFEELKHLREEGTL